MTYSSTKYFMQPNQPNGTVALNPHLGLCQPDRYQSMFFFWFLLLGYEYFLVSFGVFSVFFKTFRGDFKVSTFP